MQSNKSITTTLSLETLGMITFIVLLILKLTNTLTISWFWVCFPLWVPIAFGIAIWLVMLVIALIVALVSKER